MKVPEIIYLTLRDRQFMKAAPLCGGAAMNFALAVFNGVVGFSQPSLWTLSMAAYFAVLCLMGSYVAVCTLKPERHSAQSAMAVCGACIIILAASIAFLKYVTISESHNEELHPIVMIGMAAFTFATVAIAIVDATKARKGNGYQQAFLRISIASMLGAMMVLENQMLGTFAEPCEAATTFAIEAASGAAVVLLLLLMGVSLIRKSRKT